MATELVNLSTMDRSDLPARKAVYAIFAQAEGSGKPINCRYVGETDDLEERIGAHFGKNEQNDCLRKFLQSDKTALMRYELMPDSTKDDRLEKEAAWISKYDPKCNE